MDWLGGWDSAWPSPRRRDRGPLGACDFSVTLDTKFSRCATTNRLELMSIPGDLLAGLTKMILRVDAKGSRWAATCKASKELFHQVRESLVREGFAWWTGTGEPYLLPKKADRPDPTISSQNTMGGLQAYVSGIQWEDVVRISSGWLTNFSIDAILVALGCPILLPGAPYVARPVEGMLLLSAQLGGLANPHWNTKAQGIPWQFPRTAFWGREDVLEQICMASILIVPLNVHGNHWVVARIVKVTSADNHTHSGTLTHTEHTLAH